MSERSWCVVAMAAALWMTPFAATLAQTPESVPPVAVDWRAPAQGERGAQGDCPDAAYLEHEIERLLGDAPRFATARLHARAEVTHEVGGSWHVELTTVSAQGNGHRAVTAETCGALARATALILALAVDPDRVAKNRTLDPALFDPVTAAPVGSNATSSWTADAATPPSTADAVSPPSTADAASPPSTAKTTTIATATATPTRIDAESPVRARKRPGLPTTFALGASALVELGSLPFLGPGGGARLAAVPGFAPALRLELGAALWPWPQSAGATATSLGGTFALRAFEAGACLIPVGPCAGAELAWLSGQGIGMGTAGTTVRSSDAVWLVFRAGAMAAYRLSSAWAIRANLGLGLALAPPAFEWTGAVATVAFRPSVLSGRAALGAEVRF
jgi:hypothetical protein